MCKETPCYLQCNDVTCTIELIIQSGGAKEGDTLFSEMRLDSKKKLVQSYHYNQVNIGGGIQHDSLKTEFETMHNNRQVYKLLTITLHKFFNFIRVMNSGVIQNQNTM